MSTDVRPRAFVYFSLFAAISTTLCCACQDSAKTSDIGSPQSTGGTAGTGGAGGNAGTSGTGGTAGASGLGGAGMAATAGSGSSGGTVEIFSNGCVLHVEAQTCTTTSQNACCFLIGEHFLWDASLSCKRPLPGANPTLSTCVVTTYQNDTCGGWLPAESCYQTTSNVGLEVFVATNTVADGSLGGGWSACGDLFNQVMNASDCP